VFVRYEFLPLDYNTSPINKSPYASSWEYKDNIYYLGGYAGNNTLYIIEDNEARELYSGRHGIKFLSQNENGFFLDFDDGRLVYWRPQQNRFEVLLEEDFFPNGYRQNSKGLFFAQRVGFNNQGSGYQMALQMVLEYLLNLSHMIPPSHN